MGQAMFEIKIEKGPWDELEQVADGLSNATPLMRAIAAELESQTEANFEAEGRPHWMGLAPSTKRQREKQGTWPGKILQRSAGGLAASITSEHDADSATIGSNKVYAAIQHLGGQAGRGRKVKIPAREYLPVTAQGDLQPAAEEGVLGVVNDYLRTLCT